MFFKNGIPKLKPDIDSVEVHPGVSYYRHPMHGALVGGSLWWIVNKNGSSPYSQVQTSTKKWSLILFPNFGC
jgi:hypothetical protein